MCMVCTEWVKNKMTIREAARNARELVQDEHGKKLADWLEVLASHPLLPSTAPVRIESIDVDGVKIKFKDGLYE